MSAIRSRRPVDAQQAFDARLARRRLGVAWARRASSRSHELGHCLPAAAAEHHDVEQRVGAEPVGAVHRDAGALAGGVEAREHRVVGVDDDLAVDVGGDAAHRVVRRGLDRDRVRLRLDAEVGAHELGDVGQLGVDQLGRQVGEVEVDVVLVRAAAAALADLGAASARLTMSRGARSFTVGA